MSTWYTSDQHFCHPRIIPYDHRPFRDIDHMNQVLIDNHNDRVAEDDDVWMLGDYSVEGGMVEALGFLKKMKGHKRLIIGNHDKCFPGKVYGWKFQRPYLDAGFEVVLNWAQAKVGSIGVNLSHFPYTGDHGPTDRHKEWRLPVQEKPILHGHVHNSFKQRGNQINVGVNQWDWAPVEAKTLERMLQ